MSKATTKPRTRTSPPETVRALDAGRTPDRSHPKSRTAPHQRTPMRPGPAVEARAPLPASGRASHPEDAAGDDRLARSLADSAGRTMFSRHRERVTGIDDNDEDDLPDDEDSLEDAARAEMDAAADADADAEADAETAADSVNRRFPSN
jgi:hypothetical protein